MRDQAWATIRQYQEDISHILKRLEVTSTALERMMTDEDQPTQTMVDDLKDYLILQSILWIVLGESMIRSEDAEVDP